MSVVSFVCDLIGIVVNSTSVLPFLQVDYFICGVKNPPPRLNTFLGIVGCCVKDNGEDHLEFVHHNVQ